MVNKNFQNEHESQSPIMSVSEAAQFLRITVPTVYAWVHERRIPHRHHGRRLVFSRNDLEKWSEAHAVAMLEPLTFPRNEVNQLHRNRHKHSKTMRSLKTERTADGSIFSDEKEN